MTSRQHLPNRRASETLPEDARQIAENVTGFFTILAEWSRAEMPVRENDNDKAAADNEAGAPVMTPEITLIRKGGPNPVMSKRIFLNEQGRYAVTARNV